MSSWPKLALVGGEGVRHFAADKIASFDLDLHGKTRDSAAVSITSLSKRQLSSRIVDGPNGQVHRVEFNPSKVGSYLIDISVDGLGSPFVAKAYDSSLIWATDICGGRGAAGDIHQRRRRSQSRPGPGRRQMPRQLHTGNSPNPHDRGKLPVSHAGDARLPHFFFLSFYIFPDQIQRRDGDRYVKRIANKLFILFGFYKMKLTKTRRMSVCMQNNRHDSCVGFLAQHGTAGGGGKSGPAPF